MKNILLAVALLSALPVVVNAEENAASATKAAPKEHHMQNANPSAAPTQESAQKQAPEHVMQNADPASKPASTQEKKHTIRNN